MKALKKEEEVRITALDAELSRFLELKDRIKVLTKQYESAKDALKHRGNAAGSQYAVSIKITQMRPLMSKAELEKILGAEVEKLCKDSTRTNINVFKLGGE